MFVDLNRKQIVEVKNKLIHLLIRIVDLHNTQICVIYPDNKVSQLWVVGLRVCIVLPKSFKTIAKH